MYTHFCVVCVCECIYIHMLSVIFLNKELRKQFNHKSQPNPKSPDYVSPPLLEWSVSTNFQKITAHENPSPPELWVTVNNTVPI